MGNKRKQYPPARSSEERQQAEAELERLRPGAAAAILQLAVTGLLYGREHQRMNALAASVRKFLEKVEGDPLFSGGFPIAAGQRHGQVKVDAFLPHFEELIGAVGKRAGELREICDKLRRDLEQPAARDAAALWGQPEIAMAAFAAFGPMVRGLADAPVEFKTVELMQIAVALGVDSPKERRVARKSRWENKSRKGNIKKAVASMLTSMELNKVLGLAGLRAMALGTIPAGPFREEIAEIVFGRNEDPLPPVAADARVVVLDHDWTYEHILARLPGYTLPDPLRLILEVPRFVHVTEKTLVEWLRVLTRPPVTLSAFGVVSVEVDVQMKVLMLAQVAAKEGVAVPVEPFGLITDALRWDGAKIERAEFRSSSGASKLLK